MMHEYAIYMQHLTITPDEFDLIAVDELARILHKSEATIRSDIHRAPERVPPRVVLPGSNKLLWLRTTVATWIRQHEMGVQG